MERVSGGTRKGLTFRALAVFALVSFLFQVTPSPATQPAQDTVAIAALGVVHRAAVPAEELIEERRAQMLALSGKPTGPEGEAVPNITPDSEHGIGSWSLEDTETYLSFGMTPAGDFAGGAIADVIKCSTQYLSESDQTAVARYLSETKP